MFELPSKRHEWKIKRRTSWHKECPIYHNLDHGWFRFLTSTKKTRDQGYTTVVAHLAVAQTGKVLRKSCGYTVPWNSLYGGEKASFESTHWRISNQPKHGVKYMRTSIVWEQRLFGMMVDILDFAFDEVLCNILLITTDKEMSMVAQFLDDERNNIYIVVPKNEDHSVLENSRTLVFKSPPELWDASCDRKIDTCMKTISCVYQLTTDIFITCVGNI